MPDTYKREGRICVFRRDISFVALDVLKSYDIYLVFTRESLKLYSRSYYVTKSQRI
jgi:hypothetical protein